MAPPTKKSIRYCSKIKKWRCILEPKYPNKCLDPMDIPVWQYQGCLCWSLSLVKNCLNQFVFCSYFIPYHSLKPRKLKLKLVWKNWYQAVEGKVAYTACLHNLFNFPDSSAKIQDLFKNKSSLWYHRKKGKLFSFLSFRYCCYWL